MILSDVPRLTGMEAGPVVPGMEAPAASAPARAIASLPAATPSDTSSACTCQRGTPGGVMLLHSPRHHSGENSNSRNEGSKSVPDDVAWWREHDPRASLPHRQTVRRRFMVLRYRFVVLGIDGGGVRAFGVFVVVRDVAHAAL